MRAIISKQINGGYPMGSEHNIITRPGQYKSKTAVIRYAVPKTWAKYRIEWFWKDNIYGLPDEITYFH